MTKFYFCGSIRGGRQLASTYQKIITILKKHGQVLTEHLGIDNDIETKDRILTDVQIHDRDMSWIRDSDMLVADVTIPSLGVGYEIGRAIELGKPVMCVFKTDMDFALSAMIAGSEGIRMFYYEDPDELSDQIENFISMHAPHRTSLSS